MNTVQINGETYHSKHSISVNGSSIIIDGKPVKENAEHVLTIKVIEGSIGELKTDKSVVCEDVTGNVHAGGSVSANDIGGNVEASGSVSCDAVEGDVKAGGSVSCGEVGGSVNAGGSVVHG